MMVVKNTFEDYKKAIKAAYETAKDGDLSSFLFQPTPALLRKYCKVLNNESLSESDEAIMRLYFGVTEKGDLAKAIEHCDIDKFKPIISIFRTDRKFQDEIRMNMAAILVDFHPRPFSKFRNEDRIDSGDEGQRGNKRFVRGNPGKNKPGLKRWRMAAAGIVVVCSGFVLKTVCFPEKPCMIWKEDHYERTTPELASNPMVKYEAIDNDKLQSMKKITPCDTTTFFRDGMPVVWYSRQNNAFEYFTYPGLHPVSGKTLKPITRTIINGHISPCR
jgi:hypothetical protein